MATKKQSRTKNSYLETIRKYYPNSNYTELLQKRILQYLKKKGLDTDKVMTANSVCSDDINTLQFPVTSGGLLGPFYLGGLDGFPFTGLTGVQAFAHHMPKDGALLIYFGPHIGISEEGKIGVVLRKGQDHASSCCGAAQAALDKINNKPVIPDLLDYQEDTIVNLFQSKKKQILRARFPIQEATEVMYEAIEKRIEILITKAKKEFKGKHLILVGSVLINVDQGKAAKSCIYNRLFKTENLHTGEVKDHLKDFRAFLTEKGMH